MRRSLLVLVVVCSSLFIAQMSLSTAQAASACDLIAAPTGSDTAAGTAAAPVRTATRLVGLLTAGQTGCLRAGTYREDVAIARGAVTLTAYPGERATVVGRLWVKARADDVVVSGLTLNGANAAVLPSPTVNAEGVQFIGNDITNDHTGICFSIGSAEWGRAVGTVVRGNRIHDCGRLPSTNYDHGIYVGSADGTQIIDNVIYDNADRGIQLYPDAQGTTIRGNVIDGNGVGIIFSGEGGRASNNTLVEGNIISNATVRANVESWYPAGNPVGIGNVVRGNCISGGRGGAVQAAAGGFTATANVMVADPGFADRAAHDYQLTASSPCAGVLAGSAAPPAPNAPADPTPPAGSAAPPAPNAPADPTPPTPPSTPSAGGGTTSGNPVGSTPPATLPDMPGPSGPPTAGAPSNGSVTTAPTRSIAPPSSAERRRALRRAARRAAARRATARARSAKVRTARGQDTGVAAK